MEIIKAARGTKASDSINTSISHDVRAMLDYISQKREDAVREFASKYDNWDGDFVMSDAKRIELISQVPQQVKRRY
jgi:sulfopropanediol 3-dehydrogenase